MSRALALLVLAGCGWSEDHFYVTGVPLYCDLAAECVGFEVSACQDHIRAADRSSCDYDAGAAKRCAKRLEKDSTCEDLGDLGTYRFSAPDDCDLIWDGCGPLFDVPIDEGTSPPPITTE